MDFQNGLGGCRAWRKAAFVNPALHFDMGNRFLLKVAGLWIRTLLPEERPLDFDGVGVMPFNEIGIIAIHFAHEFGEGLDKPLRQAAAKFGGALR